MKFFVSIFVFLFVATTSMPTMAFEEVCIAEAIERERNDGIRKNLLVSIAVVESGRWSSKYGENIAWPWTINAEGKGLFFDSKEAAIEEVKSLRKRGIDSIDVGCMQVNLKYHPNAFKSLEEAFDPQTNIAYASKFVKKLFETHGSWFIAVKHYHSALSEKNIRYSQKILTAFDRMEKKAETFFANFKNNTTKTSILTSATNSDHEIVKTDNETPIQYRRRKLSEYRKRRNKKLSSNSPTKENIL